ncbi:MAG: ABC transporter permease [Lachnospirales bacterium]
MKKTKPSLFKDIKDNYQSYALLFPAFIYVFLFSYLTLPYLIMAFKRMDYTKGVFRSPWVGFSNFKFFFQSSDALRVTYNTIKLNVLFIFFITLFALILAILFNEIRMKYFKKVTQSLAIFPNFISWVVASLIIYAFLSTENGFINSILESIGLNTINFYANASYWTAILIILKIWKDAGMTSIIYLATMTGIDSEIYEAAQIDGANRWRQLLSITLPLLVPTITILTLLSIGKIFYGDFGMLYPIIGDNGVLLPTTDVIDTYVYRALRTIGDPGVATAIGLYQSIVGFVLVLGTNLIVKRKSPDNSLF